MNARTRKAVGSLAILVFIAFYMWAVSTLGDHVPKAWYFQLAYYVIAGTAWGTPVIPLIAWMNRGK
jgi:hypothetical protein